MITGGPNQVVKSMLKAGVTKPTDIDGILYIPMGDSGDDTWRMILLRELKAAGMAVDANKAFD